MAKSKMKWKINVPMHIEVSEKGYRAILGGVTCKLAEREAAFLHSLVARFDDLLQDKDWRDAAWELGYVRPLRKKD